MFSSFKDVPVGELKNQNQFQMHASSVASALNSALECLNDGEKLLPLLTQVGQTHAIQGVTSDHFKVRP